MTDVIKTKLTQLLELDTCLEEIRLNKKQATNTILTDEIRVKLGAIDDEFSPLLEAAQKALSELENQIKYDVLEHKSSVKNEGYTATFVKGRVSWDTKALNGYAAAHPEIEQFKKVGSPVVRLKKNA